MSKFKTLKKIPYLSEDLRYRDFDIFLEKARDIHDNPVRGWRMDIVRAGTYDVVWDWRIDGDETPFADKKWALEVAADLIDSGELDD